MTANTRHSRRRLRHVTLPGLVLAAAGCAHILPGPAGPCAPGSRGALDYFHWAASAPAEEIRPELGRLESGAESLDPTVRSVQTALLLSLPAHAGRDRDRALKLLDGLPEPGEIPSRFRDYRELGLLWREVLERRREDEAAVRDLRRSLEEVGSRASALEMRNEELQRQIDALKSIEEEMNRREQTEGNP